MSRVPFFALFAIPALVGIVGYLVLDGITWREFLAQLAAQAVVAGVSCWVIYWANTADTQVINGLVSGKAKTQVSCSHSYQCHCRTVCSGFGKNRTCRRVCATCYEHPFDYRWDVHSSIDKISSIAKVDRQGLVEPPRWSAAVIGEPYSVQRDFTNYIKAAPGSLFRRHGLTDKYKGKLPDYPTQVYDYYRRNPLVLANGARVADPRTWHEGLGQLNGRLGPKKQVDIVLVLVLDLPQEWFYALEQHWLGGKQNTAALVIGIDRQARPRWAAVMGWTTNQLFKVQLRDDVMDMPTITLASVLQVLERDVTMLYRRQPMSDFEYLASSLAPTPLQWFVAMLIGLSIAIGLSWLFQRHEVFE